MFASLIKKLMKTLKITILILPLLFFCSANVETKQQLDRNSIKSMCGCYAVEFNFKETFQYAKDSNYQPSPEKHDKALEWIDMIEDSENHISLQHLLQVGSPKRPIVIKHWRQDWMFENQDLMEYTGSEQWSKRKVAKKEVQGKWTQKVYQVDENPRYEGMATWVYVDGKKYWENQVMAPLPRREYTKRNDYNILERNNKIEITENGWIHHQNNKKIIRVEGEKDSVLAEEVGYNVYTKVDDSRCQASKDYWETHKDYWANVRAAWAEILKNKSKLTMDLLVEDKKLHEHLLYLDVATSKADIKKIILSYIK